MTTLIRITGGQETPAPGRWTIAPGHPVRYRIGSNLRRHQLTARSDGGALLVTDTGGLAFQMSVAAGALGRPIAERLTYQSIAVHRGPGEGTWLVDGELLHGGRAIPARSTVVYHGVYRSGPGAIAWLGWHLPTVRLADSSGRVVRLTMTADVNAQAPAELIRTESGESFVPLGNSHRDKAGQA